MSSLEPVEGCGEGEDAYEAGGGFLVTGCDGSPFLKPGPEALDLIAVVVDPVRTGDGGRRSVARPRSSRECHNAARPELPGRCRCSPAQVSRSGRRRRSGRRTAGPRPPSGQRRRSYRPPEAGRAGTGCESADAALSFATPAHQALIISTWRPGFGRGAFHRFKRSELRGLSRGDRSPSVDPLKPPGSGRGGFFVRWAAACDARAPPDFSLAGTPARGSFVSWFAAARALPALAYLLDQRSRTAGSHGLKCCDRTSAS
ncbi:hypothetical protein SAMN04487845_14328 [Methylobacterium sp. yr668]|nr:hypothetical protein SAMN04487845_14328 [Methylobacterium sp. yr668]